jgi:prepilin-type N-terminal cleavage/methylation domain-containing protein
MKKYSGFTLVEVLVAVAIISIVFTTLASIVAISLRNTSINTKKIIGAHMSDALQEWIRGEKEEDWEAFTGKIGIWCFNDPSISGWQGSPGTIESCLYYSGNYNFKYKRVVTISQSGEVYKSKVEFYWKEGTAVNKVVNETYYSQW